MLYINTLKNSCSVSPINHENNFEFTKTHRHTYFEIYLIFKSNGGKHIIDFNKYDIEDKCLYVVAPDQVHLMQRKELERGIILQFGNSYLLSGFTSTRPDILFALQTNPKTKLNDIEFSNISKLLTELKQIIDSNKNFKKEIQHHFFMHLIFEIMEIFKHKPNVQIKNKKAYHFLELAEKNFKSNRNISKYASQIGISVNNLNIEVKKMFGKTPLQVIHNMLITEIKRLLTTQDITHKEISYLLNFDSQSSYTRFVNKKLKCKPSELKQELEKIHN